MPVDGRPRAEPDGGALRELVAGTAARDGAALVLVALSSPQRCRDVAAELAGTGFGRVVHAAPADAAAAAGAAGPGELAVVEWVRDDPGPVDLLAALRRAGWPRVVVVGAGLRTATVVRVLTTGAQGYLVAAARAADRAPARRRPPQADRTPSAAAVEDVAGRERLLSGHELQVLTLTADGLSNGEIARELGLSALTVKSHLSRMTRRLEARDRAHLVLLAMRAGVLA